MGIITENSRSRWKGVENLRFCQQDLENSRPWMPIHLLVLIFHKITTFTHMAIRTFNTLTLLLQYTNFTLYFDKLEVHSFTSLVFLSSLIYTRIQSNRTGSLSLHALTQNWDSKSFTDNMQGHNNKSMPLS